MGKTSVVKKYTLLLMEMLNLLNRMDPLNDDIRVPVSKILEMQESINKLFFSTSSFSACCYHSGEVNTAISNYDTFIKETLEWLELIYGIIEMMEGQKVSIDGDFYSLMTYIGLSSQEDIINDMRFNLSKQSDEKMRITLDFYNGQQHLWGKLDPKKNIFDVLIDRAEVLKEKEEDFIWLYERLGDYRSKNVLYRTLSNWISFSHDELKRMKETSFIEYTDFDLLNCSDDEVFVDCGAYDGDSVSNFIEGFKRYKKIYCYEAEPSNFKKLSDSVKEYSNVVIKQKAVGDKRCTMYISNDEDGSSIFKGRGAEVEVVPLDEDIKESITFVKMDIEGAEQSAIKGLYNHIKEDRPKLAVCVYHGNRDIVEIPRLIDSIRDDYKFYFRNHGSSLLNIPIDTSLYAI